jgi:serine protease Do
MNRRVHRFRPMLAVVGGVGLLWGCQGSDGVAADEPLDISKLSTAAAAGVSPVGAASLLATAPAEPMSGFDLPVAQISQSRETAVVRASERVSPSVVAVNVLRTQQMRSEDPFFDDFFPFGGFGFRGRTTATLVPSLGSGFIVHSDGIILTNDHVVRGAEQILVTFPDGRDAEATLIGTDETTDVAVIRVQERDLSTVQIGRTSDLQIGEWAIALGNPFGNMLSNPEPTVTVGVVSAVGRHIVPSREEAGFYLGMIQTDAAINPGNSGGPLVNALGEVIGMNASIFSRSGGSEGLGFAIPIERVLRIADDLIKHGEVRRAWLGVEVEPEEADAFGRTRGVLVSRTLADSPAHRAQIGVGDRLLKIGGRRMVTPLDFEAALLDLRAGDQVLLSIEGHPEAIQLIAGQSPSLRAERITVFEDLEIVSLTDAIRSERGVESAQGALVTRISPELQRILDLREGDVIVQLGNRGIQGAEDLSRVLEQVPAGATVRLYFERNRGYAARDFVLGR